MTKLKNISLLRVVGILAFHLGIIPAVLPAGLPVNHRHQILTSPVLSHWGEWGKLEHCPSDQVVVGMQLKVHENQGVKDDTGLNAVKFYCQNPYSSTEYSKDVVSITSLVGSAGDWKQDFFCPNTAETKSVAVGFQLKSETSSGVKDDTAGNNLKLVCSDLQQKEGFTVLEGDGTDRGEWTKQQVCWAGYAICGLQTQVEVSRSMDTTGLNNLKVRCCKADGFPQNGTFHTIIGSGESGSTQIHDGSSSTSVEGKDFNHTMEENISNYRPYDYFSSGEGSFEGGWDENVEENENENEHEHVNVHENVSQNENPSEQELVAIDPKPVDFGLESPSNPSSETGHSVENTNVLGSTEDENLSEEISRIDQADNSEAAEEEGTAVTTSYSQKIPEDIVNALADADISDFGGEDHHQFHDRHGEASHGLQDDSSNFSDMNTSDMSEETDSNGRPKSSPRFGHVGSVKTNVTKETETSAASTASFIMTSHLSTLRTLGIGSMIFLYIFKSI